MVDENGANDARKTADSPASNDQNEKAPAPKTSNREIKGNIPYSPSPGSITSVLDAIISAERPEKFTNNFMETVLNNTGGGARSVPPFLKKMNFLASDGSPTELYSKFKTESGRPSAAYAGLRSAFAEIFKRNEFAHKATEEKMRDTLVEITGLKASDQVLRMMLKSFDAVKRYIPENFEAGSSLADSNASLDLDSNPPKVDGAHTKTRLGLSYQINIILPETTDQMVYDSIFKSLKRNMLE